MEKGRAEEDVSEIFDNLCKCSKVRESWHTLRAKSRLVGNDGALFVCEDQTGAAGEGKIMESRHNIHCNI